MSSRIRVRQEVDGEQPEWIHMFPKVYPGERRAFREACGNPILVKRKADEFRQVNPKYKKLTDDYDCCMYYLKEKYLDSFKENIALGGNFLNVITIPLASKYQEGLAKAAQEAMSTGAKSATLPFDPVKAISSISSAIETRASWLAECGFGFLKPSLELTIIDDEDDLFFIPRSEQSVSELKGFLSEIGLPPHLSNSAGDCVSEGTIQPKAVYSLFLTAFGWFMSSSTVPTEGMNQSKFGAGRFKR